MADIIKTTNYVFGTMEVKSYQRSGSYLTITFNSLDDDNNEELVHITLTPRQIEILCDFLKENINE